jgi:Na+/H+-translocating membrane pyrophosphatase
MRIAIKYGLLITLVVAVWIILTHFVVPLPPSSKLNLLGPLLFNLAAIIAIYLGINERKAESDMNFKMGIKTGLAISVVYAISACLFFLVVLLIVGPSMMANEPMAADSPFWRVALGAFAGMFFGSLILGLVYSTIISFFLARRYQT